MTAVGEDFFFHILYQGAVQNFFMQQMEEVAEKLRDTPLSLAVDVKYDSSPGEIPISL